MKIFQSLSMLLLCSTLQAQQITHVSEIAVANLKNARIVNGLLIVDALPTKIEGVVLTTFTVDTKIPKITFSLTDVYRKSVAFKQIGDTKVYVTTATGDLWAEAQGIDFDLKEILNEKLEVHVEPLTPPEPGPTPDPKPPQPPLPEPVKSFRVIFVKESGQTLNPEQTAVSSARVIRDYLGTKATPEGNIPGYREYDPQQSVTNEQPAMKALWAAAKSSITTVPCVIVEVNGKVRILPYPKNTTEALKVLKEIGGN